MSCDVIEVYSDTEFTIVSEEPAVTVYRSGEIFSLYVEVGRTDAGCAVIGVSSFSLTPCLPAEGNVSGFRCIVLFL